MINKHSIKQKSDELNIPFKNLLSAVVCESIIEIISDGSYCNELYLCNGEMFNGKNYKDNCVGEIYYEYGKILDEKMAVLYMRDVLKEIISKAALEALAISGVVENGEINLKVTVDDMYVPIRIYMSKHRQTLENDFEEFIPIMHEKRKIKYLANSKEEELSQHLIEIIEKLELINDMDHYYYAYEILTKYPINGRKVNDRLKELLIEKSIKLDDNRIAMLKSYENYAYMKKKWKVELRQKNVSQPEWKDTVNCLIKFIEPIWNTIQNNMIFLGDWMPQLKRFLD